MDKVFEQTIAKEDIEKVNKYMGRCSTWAIFRKMQIKTIPMEWLQLKRQTKQSASENVEELFLSYITGRYAMVLLLFLESTLAFSYKVKCSLAI